MGRTAGQQEESKQGGQQPKLKEHHIYHLPTGNAGNSIVVNTFTTLKTFFDPKLEPAEKGNFK